VGIKRAMGVEGAMGWWYFVDLIQLASEIEERKLQLRVREGKQIRKQLRDRL